MCTDGEGRRKTVTWSSVVLISISLLQLKYTKGPSWERKGFISAHNLEVYSSASGIWWEAVAEQMWKSYHSASQELNENLDSRYLK